MEEEAQAEQRGDLETAWKLIDELHGMSLFRIVGLDKERGARILSKDMRMDTMRNSSPSPRMQIRLRRALS